SVTPITTIAPITTIILITTVIQNTTVTLIIVITPIMAKITTSSIKSCNLSTLENILRQTTLLPII
ncbi:10587_t:CDS:1, partial [Dentiscutata heterogama]